MIKCTFFDPITSKCNNEIYNCVHCNGSVVDGEKTIITKDFSEDVYFAPWIGKDYEKANFFDKRILIVGNSHYCKKQDLKQSGKVYEKCAECGYCIKQLYPECCRFTIDVVGYYITSIRSKVPWISLEVVSALDDESLIIDNTYKKVLDSIAFYNFVQEALPNGTAVPNTEQCRRSEVAFFEVLEKLRPELIIALGTSHMYYKDMPNDTYENGQPITIDGRNIKHGYYHLADNTKVHTVWIYHPSARRSYDYLFWNQAIKQAIETE